MNKESNTACNCPRKCERHGKCEECIKYHSNSKIPCYCKKNNKNKEKASG